MRNRKFAKALVLAGFIVSLFPVNILATEVSLQSSAVTIDTASVAPRAEETRYYYMDLDGVTYKRLWSITRGVWIDPYWYPA